MLSRSTCKPCGGGVGDAAVSGLDNVGARLVLDALVVGALLPGRIGHDEPEPGVTVFICGMQLLYGILGCFRLWLIFNVIESRICD